MWQINKMYQKANKSVVLVTVKELVSELNCCTWEKTVKMDMDQYRHPNFKYAFIRPNGKAWVSK